jgi:hypothetical protein
MVWDILRLGSMSGTDQARICENSVCLARKDVGRNAGSIKIVKSEVLALDRDQSNSRIESPRSLTCPERTIC